MDYSFVLAPHRLAEGAYCAMCGALLDTVDDPNELNVALWIWKGRLLRRVCDTCAEQHSGALHSLSYYLRKKRRAIHHILGRPLPPPRFQVHLIPYAEDSEHAEPRIVREVDHLDDAEDSDDLFSDDPDADFDAGDDDADVSAVA